MEVVFVTMVCAAVAGPFIAMALALKPRHCPNCGAAVEPDKELVRTFIGS